MNGYKIGDKVQFKNTNEFLGYVSYVNKGHLFLLDDFEVRVHLGNKEHIMVNASELDYYKENCNLISD